jgi:hypothetical protein
MTARRVPRWLMAVLCAAILGYFMLRAVAVHRDYAKREVEPVAAVASDSNEAIWQTGDSTAIRVRYIPHGRGVVVEIMPVRKAKPVKSGKGGKK